MFSVLISIWKQLSSYDRARLASTLFARMILVGFDLGGVALVGISVAVATGTKTTPNSITGQITNQLSDFSIENPYAFIAVIAIIFFSIKAVASILLNRYMANFIAKLESKKSEELYTKLMSSDLDNLERYTQSTVSFALIGSTAASFNLALTSFSIVFGEIVMIIGVSLYLLSVNPMLFALMSAYLGLVGYLMNFLTASRNRIQARRLAEDTIEVQRLINDSFSNFRQISVSMHRTGFGAEFGKKRQAIASAQAEISVLNVLPRYITEIALMVGLGFLIGQRSLIEYTSISAATIAIFIAGSFRIVASLLPLQGSINSLRQVEELGRSSLAILGDLSKKEFDLPANSQVQSRPDVVVNGISHSYSNGKTILSELNLKIPFGSKVLIRGESGSGKSTLLDILLGLRNATYGLVTIGGISPTQYRQSSVQNLGYVSQSAPLIEGSLAQNISLDLTTENADAATYRDAIAIACLEDLVNSLPGGIEAKVKPGSLSGGQVQRVAIARAIFNQPKILILDECTSALDATTASRILDNIFQVSALRTVIIVSHDDLSMRPWDQVIEISDKGVVVTGPDKISEQGD